MKSNRQTWVALSAKPAFEVSNTSKMAWKCRRQMKLWMFTSIVAASLSATAQASDPIGGIPTEEDCLAFIAILPTFQSKAMTAYYAVNPSASGKELVEKLQAVAEGGDKAAQFTYSMLLRNGYCVPQDACAAQRYLEKSRGGPNNWEQMYPVPPWPKEAEANCKNRP